MTAQDPADECAAMAPPTRATAPHCADQLKEAITISPMQPVDPLHVRQLKAAIRILRLPQLEQRTGLKHSSIYARLSPRSKHYDPRFPRQISLVAKTSATCHRRAAVGWIESEVDAYLEQLSSERFSK